MALCKNLLGPLLTSTTPDPTLAIGQMLGKSYPVHEDERKGLNMALQADLYNMAAWIGQAEKE